MAFVIDASVALGWSFEDERDSYALSILDRLNDELALVPPIWILEVANGLLIAERRGRLTEADTVKVHGILANLRIDLAEATLELGLASILPIARAQELTAYDATYLELAMREGLPLATLDDELRAAAERVGVPLVN
jgi:predicted nucleic acid-binding protein